MKRRPEEKKKREKYMKRLRGSLHLLDSSGTNASANPNQVCQG
jgi:hypothetical protein